MADKSEPDGIVLTDAQKKSRRQRSIAIALALGVLVLLGGIAPMAGQVLDGQIAAGEGGQGVDEFGEAVVHDGDGSGQGLIKGQIGDKVWLTSAAG